MARARSRTTTHKGALTDLAEAVNYLQREAPEQAQRLRTLYREARQRIQRNPLAYAPLYDDYRRTFLMPFKYMIVYVTDGQNIDILAVLPAQRDPEALKSELAGRTFD